MSQINYADKVQLQENALIPDINKVKATDMNEIKTAHNDTDTRVTGLENAVSLFSGSTAVGNAIVIPESIYNFKEIIVKCNNAGIYMCGSITKGITMSQITAGGFQPSTTGQYVASIYFTPSSDGLTLTSNSNANYINISTTPSVVKTSLQNITNIWGIR